MRVLQCDKMEVLYSCLKCLLFDRGQLAFAVYYQNFKQFLFFFSLKVAVADYVGTGGELPPLRSV